MRSSLPSFVRKMSTISGIPQVDIDAKGVFKYILIKLDCVKDGKEIALDVVRGYESCPYHTDINDAFTEHLQKMKQDGDIDDWKTKVLGGGRITHDPVAKSIKVYGYSQGYGKADHEVTAGLLKKVYKDYEISCSDEGY